MRENRKAELARVLSVFDNTLITLSLISPASVLFVMAPIALGSTGLATFWSFVIGALICLAMAFCWAELGSAYPSAGGDYAVVRQVIGPSWGFVALLLQLTTAVLVPPLFGLGLASYLKGVVDLDPVWVAMVAIGLAALIATLRVRIGAAVTGVFLAVELAVLALLAYLGLSHIERPFLDLVIPQAVESGNSLKPINMGLIMNGAALAMFCYDGYRCAINLSEEMLAKGRGIARATLWSLSIAVVAELVPLTAVLLGAVSIAALAQAPDLTAFVLARGGDTLHTITSLAVAGAILNCLIAFFIIVSRLLYSSGRDQSWPEALNRRLVTLHPRFKTPWLATILFGLLGIILTPLTEPIVIGNLVGALVTFSYVMIAICAIVDRFKSPRLERPYRMPWWPLAPALSLLAIGYLVLQLPTRELLSVTVIIALALLYYFVCLARKPESRWIDVAKPPQPDRHLLGDRRC